MILNQMTRGKHEKQLQENVVLTAAIALVLGLALSANAATASFTAKLPKNQGDTEVSTVARSTSASKNFCVKINSISNGFTHVRAWVEGTAGKNFSNPLEQISIGTAYINYTTVPAAGKNMILNLDNPVKSTTTPTVKGSWSPR